jgi:hypothetical protein
MKTIPASFLLAALLLISASGLCRANLGDSEAQCIARYGPESDVRTDLGYRQVGNKSATFTFKNSVGSLFVKIIFLNGLSCHESICNSDASDGLTQDQMKAILDSQSSGMKWEKGRTEYRTVAGETYGSTEWKRSDGAEGKFWFSGKAASQNHTGQVSVSTRQYAVAQATYDKENGDN